MAVIPGQKPLPLQTPNNNTPLVRVALDATGLFDSQGKPITGQVTADGHITPAWRYLFGQFAQQAAAAAAASAKLVSNSSVSLGAQSANVALATLFTPTVAGLYRVSMYIGMQNAGNPVGIAGTISWNDGSHNQSATTSSLDASSASFVSQSFVLYVAANQPVKYSTTIGGAGGIGAGTYMLQIQAEQL